MKIAIFGAAGAIGRVALPELLRRGHGVRVVGRDVKKLETLAAPGVEIVSADLSDPAGARRAAEGVDAILHCAGLPYHQFGRYSALMRTTVEAAQAAPLNRLLATSPAATAAGVCRQRRGPHVRSRRALTPEGPARVNAHEPACTTRWPPARTVSPRRLPPPYRRPRRRGMRIAAAAAVALGVVVGAFVVYAAAVALAVRGGVARTAGTVAGLPLDAPVRIVRDERDVPHIRAQTIHDLFFAQGYVTGSDRLFQHRRRAPLRLRAASGITRRPGAFDR